jgi:hypothetical protein
MDMKLPPAICQQFPLRFISILTIALCGITLPIFAGTGTQQLTCTPSDLLFGFVAIGQTETQLVVLANSGQTNVTVSAITLSETQFSAPNLSLPLTVPAGQSVAIEVAFSPDAASVTQAVGTITSDASNSNLGFRLRGTGIKRTTVTSNPSSVSFGQVTTGKSSTLPVVLTNTHSSKVTLYALSTTAKAFSVSGPTFPLVLERGQSVTLNVTFAPESAETISGSVLVSGPTLRIPMDGNGTGSSAGQLTISPSQVNFGNVDVNTTETLPMTMSASGSSVTVSSYASSNSNFVLNGASLPFTIPAGQSLSFNVAFSPKSAGTDSGSLTFISDASDSKAVEQLTGNGIVSQHTVNLSWDGSSDVVGYNVYRSTSANGSYAKINSALDPITNYSDSSVLSGTTYYYEATAVSSDGQESVRSTPPVQAMIP